MAQTVSQPAVYASGLIPKIQGTYLCTHKMENQTWYTKVMQKMLCIAFTVYDANPEINLKNKKR